MKLNIYIETDIKGPQRQQGYWRYQMEAVGDDGALRASNGCRKEHTGNEYSATLEALMSAAGRIRKGTKAQITIFTDCDMVRGGIYHLRAWQRDGWKRSRGRTIQYAKEWQAIGEALSGTSFTAVKK
ncbi:MAG: hypothetical protein IJ110_01540 [Lachnospiraceae bacterium]|nr:hypothetical protein [Lachnospiraceae bacterium]